MRLSGDPLRAQQVKNDPFRAQRIMVEADKIESKVRTLPLRRLHYSTALV